MSDSVAPSRSAQSFCWLNRWFPIALVLLSFAGNYFKIPILFHADWLFGTVFALIAVRLYGLFWGTLAAAIAASYTIYLWKQPYAFIFFTLEVVFVGWGLKRYSKNLLLLDVIYWALIGIPLTWITYVYFAKIAPAAVVFISLKNPVNQICNALIASLILAHTPIARWVTRSKASTLQPFEQTLFNLFVAFVFIPALILTIWNCQAGTIQQESQMLETLNLTAREVGAQLESWQQENQSLMAQLASTSTESNLDPNVLQYAVRAAQQSFSKFRNLYIVNSRGEILAAVLPPQLPSERPEYRSLLAQQDSVFSEVLLAGSSPTPLLLQNYPIRQNGRLVGQILAEIDLEALRRSLARSTGSDARLVTLLNAQQQVMLSTRPELKPLQLFNHRAEGEVQRINYRVYRWLPPAASMPKVVRWRKSFYVQEVATSEKFPWKVVVELASAPYLDVLDHLYTNSFATLMAIAILSPLVAKAIGRSLVQPLRQLKNVTTNLPDKLLESKKLDLPDSQIAEINALTDNYQLMATVLQNKFQEIQQANREIQQAKEIADSANQAKSEFLASMSHELRTPLNGILGYAQILSRSKVLPEKERHGANIIHECGAHLLTLINDVLDLSKIEARKLELSPHAIHLPSLLQGVVEICQIRADQKGLRFHYEPEVNLPEGVEADEKRLRQVLINLLGNAIKFTDKGSVSLRVNRLAYSERSVRLRFCISDTGTGIAPENLDKLFQAFKQVGDKTRQAEGTGLGLAISQQIVQLMGGQIQLESQLGVGSEFFFTLEMPLAGDWGKQQTARANHIIGYKGSSQQILVVDDRWENRSVLVNLLEPLGFKAIEAENGQEALEQMRQELPDLVITDLSMPVMDGFEMLKQLRSENALKSLKVIVSSASVSQRDQQKGLRGGGDYFLAKPIHAEELFQLLAESLHLDWVYEELSPQARSLYEPAEVVIPPREQLEQLLEFAQKGRLRQLIALAEKMSKQDECYQPFAKQIVPMARQFQTEQLEQLLQNHLASENNL